MNQNTRMSLFCKRSNEWTGDVLNHNPFHFIFKKAWKFFVDSIGKQNMRILIRLWDMTLQICLTTTSVGQTAGSRSKNRSDQEIDRSGRSHALIWACDQFLDRHLDIGTFKCPVTVEGGPITARFFSRKMGKWSLYLKVSWRTPNESVFIDYER